MHLPLGTLVNVLAVIVGSALGLLLQRAFPERYRRILLTAGGLATLALGAQMAIKSGNPLVLIGSLYLGGLIGEALGIEAWLERIGERVQRLSGTGALARGNSSEQVLDEGVAVPSSATGEGARATKQTSEHNFTHGLVTAFLVFCVGPMTILGALNEGMTGSHELLYVKSGLDLVTSFVLASSFGVGVLASAVPLALFQLAITAIGALAGTTITAAITTELTAVGGALIIGLGLNLLGVAKLKVANLLPALVIVIVVMLILARLSLQ